LLVRGGDIMEVARIRSPFSTVVKSGFFLEEKILYYDCLTLI